MSRADNSIKNWRNLPISNPKPDLHSINAHTKFVEKPLLFTQVIIRKRKMDRRTDGCSSNSGLGAMSHYIFPKGFKGYKLPNPKVYNIS